MQRSGTNFLRRIIGSHPAIDPLFGEIFDPSHIDEELSFFNFYQRLVAESPSFCLPDKRILAFEKYIEFLDRNVPSEHYVLDVKYNSIRQMESYWSREKEIFVQYIIDKQWPVIHLIRTDLVAAVFSHIRARQTGVWMTEKSDYCDTSSVIVDPVVVVNAIAQRRQAIQRYRRSFQGARLLELMYEDFMDGSNGVSESTVEQLGRFLNVTDRFSRVAKSRKLIIKPMSQAIRNYGDVLEMAATRNVPLSVSV
jgi:hypothetical protein